MNSTELTEEEIEKQVEMIEQQINTPEVNLSFIQKMQYLTLVCAPNVSYSQEAICKVSSKICSIPK